MRNTQHNWVHNIPRPVQVAASNICGANPLNTLAGCDFDGDGRSDEFMVTGTTCWARPAETQQWRYLPARTEQLGVPALGDFDGDGRGDGGKKPRTPAQSVSTYSRNGTGPWVPVRR